MRARSAFFAVCSLLAISAAALLLGVCGQSKVGLDEAQAKAAVQVFIDARNPVCQTFFAKWPIQITDYERRNNSYHAQRIAALEAAGLVRHDASAILPKSVHKPSAANAKDYIATKIYRLSLLGEQNYRSNNADEGKFCYGKKVIERIAQVSPVNTSGKEPRATVRFVYQLQDLADWAATPELLAVFPTMDREIKGMGQEAELHLVWREKTWRVDPIASL
jgi:hypothetical protein